MCLCYWHARSMTKTENIISKNYLKSSHLYLKHGTSSTTTTKSSFSIGKHAQLHLTFLLNCGRLLL